MRRLCAALIPLNPVQLLKYYTRSISENTRGGKNKMSKIKSYHTRHSNMIVRKLVFKRHQPHKRSPRAAQESVPIFTFTKQAKPIKFKQSKQDVKRQPGIYSILITD